MEPEDEKPDGPSSFSKLRRELAAQERVGPGPPPRMLPPRRRSRAVTFIVCYVVIVSAFTFAVMRTNSEVPLPVIAVALAGLFAFLYFNRRCSCGGRLIERLEPVEGVTGQRHLYLDCSRCRTVWDSGKMVDDEEENEGKND